MKYSVGCAIMEHDSHIRFLKLNIEHYIVQIPLDLHVVLARYNYLYLPFKFGMCKVVVKAYNFLIAS
jgi:hypothetical protein